MKKVKLYVIEFTHKGRRTWYRESLNSQVAYALGRELARQGRRPTVRRLDVTIAQLEQLLRTYESLR
jgi:hypothetical protein